MMLFARTCSSFGFFCILGSLSISGFSVYFVLFYFWPPKISWVTCWAVGRGLSPWAVRARPKYNIGPGWVEINCVGSFRTRARRGRANRMYTYNFAPTHRLPLCFPIHLQPRLLRSVTSPHLDVCLFSSHCLIMSGANRCIQNMFPFSLHVSVF